MKSKILFCILAIFLMANSGFAQKKYQSLMWEVTYPGCTKPSYIYGTMHISGKMVFHLGDKFYSAIEKVDVVALELEPEAWLQAIFDDKDGRFYSSNRGSWDSNYGFGSDYDRSIPMLRDNFKVHTDISEKVQGAMMYDPALLNYMLFRYDNYGASADFEEDTWLDMYIYQTGKKLGKETLGLETYEQSDNFLKKARKEERNTKNKKKKSLDEGDRKELEELSDQMEPAYRRQDLDLIDSLNKRTTSEAFDKYILVERNKVFVHRMDSVMKSGRTIFAGMGCAHLPGDSGVIEMLRGMGYTIKPFDKGERNAKRREKLENTIYKRSYKSYTTRDGQLTFDTSTPVYDLGAGDHGASWISLDIPNGSSFIVYRMKTHAGLRGLTDEAIMASIDSILYEAVPGDIVSQKKINVQGYTGLDIVNKTRRGDYQRKQLIILPEEIVVLKLTATGQKVKAGFGNEYFNSFKINFAKQADDTKWTSQDGSVSLNMPGHIAYYQRNLEQPATSDFEVNSYLKEKDEYYIAQRLTVYDPGFLDEDEYEVNRLADAFQEDNELKEINRKFFLYKGLPAVKSHSKGFSEKDVYNLFVIQNLNYCAFTAITNDSVRAEAYLNSLSFTQPAYTKWQEFADTTNYFKVELPYEQLQEGAKDAYSWEWASNDEDKNEFDGARGSINLAPHGSDKAVTVQWWRFEKYSWSSDSALFMKNTLDNYIKDAKLTLINKDQKWTPTGFELQLNAGDTACTRRFMAKTILHNHTLYELTTNYDSLLGPGEFVTRVFETFTPTDTAFAYYHFRNRNEEYFNLLFSTDSATQANAIGISQDVSFKEKDMPGVRQMLPRVKEIKDDEKQKTLRKNLTRALRNDTSSVNIDFISKEYYNWMDSANYQVELLNQLLRMKTKASYAAYKKLILDEPPIPTFGKYDSYKSNTFMALKDSLKLSATVFPDIMQLKALDEYESDVYALTATLIDSSFINKNVFEKEIGLVIIEAKNELKRLNSSDEEGSNFNTDNFVNYLSLLQPYRTKPEVKTLFEKAYKTKKTKLLLELASFDIRHDVIVPDSVLQKVVSNEKRVIPLYNNMFKAEKQNLFPNTYNNREKLIEIYVKNKFADKYDKKKGKIDSVQQILSAEKTIRNHAFDVYYYKYKAANSDQWKGVLFAFDKEDSTNIWPKFIERTVTIVLDKDENEVEEMDKEFKRMVEMNRRKFKYTDGENISNSNWY